MIGIGKWEATVSAMMVRLTGQVEIQNDNGEYKFIYEMPEKFKNLKVEIISVEEENSNTLFVKALCSAIPEKVFEIHATFKDDTLTGYIKAPIMGGLKVKIKDGRRIN